MDGDVGNGTCVCEVSTVSVLFTYFGCTEILCFCAQLLRQCWKVVRLEESFVDDDIGKNEPLVKQKTFLSPGRFLRLCLPGV